MNNTDKFQVTSDLDITNLYRLNSPRGKEVMSETCAKARPTCISLPCPREHMKARGEFGRSILMPDPKTYALVQEAKRLRAEGISIRKICKVMELKGLRSQEGNKIGPMSTGRPIHLGGASG